jgi:hypothetical protein
MRCIKAASGALPDRPGQAVGRGHRAICMAVHRCGFAEAPVCKPIVKLRPRCRRVLSALGCLKDAHAQSFGACECLPGAATSLRPPELLACGRKRPQVRFMWSPAINRMESGNQMGHASPSMSKAAPAGRVSAMAFAAVPDGVEPPFPHVHRHVSIKRPTRSREPQPNIHFHCHPPVTENRCRKA